MLDNVRVEQLISQWEELLAQGQYIPAEELCMGCPELLEEVQKRIDQIEPRAGEETAVAEVGGMATVIEPERSKQQDVGALVLQQAYRKLRFHAKGGLGEIYVADDEELQRDVVLKFIRPKHRDRRDCREQFQLEAEVTARLDHPGVVPVYGFGRTPDGRLCYAMRFIQGEILEERIAKVHNNEELSQGRSRKSRSLFGASRSVEFRNLLNRLVTVCQTIAYAHNRGILHRDLKPENIMLGKYGDTLVVDWGLAMPIDRDESARASGEQTLMPSSGSGTSSSGSSGGPVGTPAYMPPEQASGVPNLTPACDIFSLGATLYKLLVGQAPYTGDSARDTLTRARYGSFTPPREVNSDVPVGLDAICCKAMATDPAERYFTASEMAEDIERWLADEPIQARAETRLESCGRWIRRHREWTMAIVLMLAAVSTIGSIAAVSQGRLADSEHDARIAAQDAHVESLQLTAQFVARAVGKDLQSRWLILQRAAADPELTEILQAATDPEAASSADLIDDAHAWLTNYWTKYSLENGSAVAASWHVTLANGHNLARAPRSSKSQGKFFGFRDYFHGQGEDLDAEKSLADLPSPIVGPHRSIVFKSRATDEFMVALSVPILGERQGPDGSTRKEVLGVLGMSQSLGDFDILRARNSEDRVLVLVDTSTTQINEKKYQGIVLHDSRSTDPEWLAEQAALSETKETRQVPQGVQEQLIELRAVRRLQQEKAVAQPATSKGAVQHQYADYADPEHTWAAAFEPVIFGRPPGVLHDADESPIEDTGWVVVVQEPAVE